MGREYNAKIFRGSMNLCRTDPELRESIRRSLETQFFVSSGENVSLPSCGKFRTSVRVTDERSFQAAEGLAGKTCVHNFASFRNPGGGVKNGSSAQEESLCRISTLYPCLSSEKADRLFYSPHRNHNSCLYNSDLIYTPGVTIFRKDDSEMALLPPENRYSADVVTCAAPNLSSKGLSVKEQYGIHRERIGRIMSVAADSGAESLVLGAFGCGVFRNDPAAVAKASKDALSEHEGCFREVVFAIYGSGENLDAFRSELGR